MVIELGRERRVQTVPWPEIGLFLARSNWHIVKYRYAVAGRSLAAALSGSLVPLNANNVNAGRRFYNAHVDAYMSI